MARVVTTELDGYRTCARPRIRDSTSWADDTVLEQDCAGYRESDPVRILREEVIFTFRDGGADTTPGFDIDQAERSTVRYLPADGDWSCPHCGFDTCSFDVTPRPKYMSRSDQSQDELRTRSMRGEKREEKQVDAAERQAAALEKLAEQAAENRRVAALEAQVADLQALLAANGHGEADNGEEPASPRPKARAKA